MKVRRPSFLQSMVSKDVRTWALKYIWLFCASLPNNQQLVNSTARAIREQTDPMLSNGSRSTLMSYTDHSVQRRLKSNAPTVLEGPCIMDGSRKANADVQELSAVITHSPADLVHNPVHC